MGLEQSRPRPQGIPGRVIIEIQLTACCSHGPVLKDMNMPTPLSDRGLSQADWDEFVGERLTRIINGVAVGMCDTTACVLTCCVYMCTCRPRKQRMIRAETAEWKADFNKVLDPLGISCTIKSHAYSVSTGEGTLTRLKLR